MGSNHLSLIDSKIRTAALTAALLSLLCVGVAAFAESPPGPPYQANGIKSGEARQTSVNLWTRLTRYP